MTEPVTATSFPKSEIKILLLENIHPVAVEAFRAEGFQVETARAALPEAELAQRVRDIHLLGIRSKTQVTPGVLDEARRLLAVGAFCIGTNQIALRHATCRGVAAFNAPFSNTRSVAELILAEVVMLSRHLGDRLREVHDGRWRKVAAGSHEVRGKTLGIVGYGHIGSQVGVLAEAFGMRVVFHDIVAKLPMGNNRALPRLADVLEASDFVTLHVPETPLTRNMIGPEQLARMKPGACLLNASRGSVVVIDALAEAIRRGHVGGAAVDVYPEEPEANSDGFASPLRGLSNVILTPHIGGSTEEAQEAIGREVSAALIKYVNTGATTSAVNFPHMELPLEPGAHRILNVHRNVPGVLRDINRIVSDHNANIRAQMLSTDPDIGYLLMDLDQDVSQDVKRGIAALPTSIKTRILF
ncbi:MAG: phosphoglycerate dehydrogenase [Deltaproteobacteria bacterium]|nr:MAG: phosphoglycerate dehydrogenase [Deltaproteobacteria bacterium]